jgi:hypothetical protein
MMSPAFDKTVYLSGHPTETGYFGVWVSGDAYPHYPPQDMPDKFGTGLREYKGYSSHMHGVADALLAVSRGAKYIEKHVTLDKTAPFPRDNAFALDFTEFSEMVKHGNEISRLA